MENLAQRVLKQFLHIPSRTPFCVQIEITNVCNLDCGMCPRHHVDVPRQHMDFEVLKKVLSLLDRVDEVSLVGLGEPFTHPLIFEAIRLCRQRGLKVKITTNGLLLGGAGRLEEVVRSGLDDLTFSLEGLGDSGATGGHRSRGVAETINELVRLKKKTDSTTPAVVLQTVMIKGREQDLYDLIRWGATAGVERINVLRMTKYFETGLPRPDMDEEKKIFRDLARLRRTERIRIDCLQDQFYSGVKGWAYRQGKRFLNMDSSCLRLRDYPYITVNGDMTPCCVLPDQQFGSLLATPLKDVWLGDAFQKFRREHMKNPVCARCDNLRLRQVVR